LKTASAEKKKNPAYPQKQSIHNQCSAQDLRASI